MAGKKYTVDDLVTSVRNRASIPDSSGNITDEDILRFANEEIDENMVPLILSTREEFFLTYTDVAVNQNTLEYDLPYRAIGMRVRIIKPLDNQGGERAALPNVPLDYIDGSGDGYYESSYSRGYYLKSNKIVLAKREASVGTLRVYYYLRPNDLVLTSRVGTITAIDTDTNTVTVSRFPTNITSSSSVDFVKAVANQEIYDFDISVASVSTGNKTITTSTALPSELQVGDYVCSAGEAPTPQIPTDVIPILEQAVTCKVLESIGDTEGLKNAAARLQKLEQRLLNILDARIEAPGRKAVQQNSLLVNRRRSRFGS